jgi:hypothetical protein
MFLRMLPRNSDPPAEVLAEIRSRLVRVCSNYEPSELDALVHEIASVRAKYDAMRTQAFFADASLLADAAPILRKRDQGIVPRG